MRNILFYLSMVAICIVISPGLHAGKIYQWVDENGKRHFSQTPPPETQGMAVVKTGSSSSIKPREEEKGIYCGDFKVAYKYKRGNQFWELEFLSSSVNPWSEGSFLADDYLVRLTAGYGATNCESLPEAFTQAIKMQVIQWFRYGFDGNLTDQVKKIVSGYNRNIYL